MPVPNDLYIQLKGGAKSTDLQPAGTAAVGTKLYFSPIDHIHPGSDAVASDMLAGTQALPGLSFQLDPDTGIFQAAASANTLSVAAGAIETIRFNTVTTGVNYFNVTPSATATPLLFEAAGTDTDIGITIRPKGAGVTTLGTAGSANGTLAFAGSTSGTTTVKASATAAGTLTLPAVTGVVASTTGTNLYVPDLKKTSASVTVNTSATYVNVTGQSYTVVPGTYEFVLRLPSTVASGTGGIKYAFHYTTTVVSSLEATGRGYTASAVAVQHTTTTTDVADLFSQAAVVIFTEITGSMVVGTGGTIDIQMAQNTSNGSNTIALIGGTAQFTRIA